MSKAARAVASATFMFSKTFNKNNQKPLHKGSIFCEKSDVKKKIFYPKKNPRKHPKKSPKN